MAGIHFSAARFEVFGAAEQSMVENPDGPVGLALLEIANAAKLVAQVHCPVESVEEARRRGRARYRLRDSLQVRRDETHDLGPGLSYLIGSDLIFARRIEFNPTVGGFLRKGVAAIGGPHVLRSSRGIF